MVRPIALILAVLTLSLAEVQSAAASPSISAGPRAPAQRARARLAPPAGSAHRPRAVSVARPEASASSKAPATSTSKAPAISTSVGHPNDGRLAGGVRLDTARKELRVVPTYAGEDIRWGLPALVGMIERASRGVARRFPGAVLDVGDLSRKEGGEVHRHHSHESGRDVDLGFYAVDPKGKQVHAGSFIRFGAGLASTNVPGARLDSSGRTWLLVQHLLSDPRAHVSHIFIAEPLRYALLAHAKRLGVSRALLVRAQLAMMQPTGAEPHDDHMHVRISCPSSMRGSCVELAKSTPSFRDRVRAAKVLRTPKRRGAPRSQPAQAPAGAAQAPKRATPRGAAEAPGRGSRASSAARGAEGDDARAAVAAGMAVQEPMGALDLGFLDPSSDPPRDAEAEPDDGDAKGALDDSGALKITD